jgi:predicted nucleotidyltransferase
MKAFITGSRAYGKPKPESDIDLVIRVEPQVEDFLRQNADSVPGKAGIRYGNLNLIMCSTDRKYELWEQGTEELIAEAPVTREQACKKFKDLEASDGRDSG